MKQNTVLTPSSPAIRPTPAIDFEELLRESYDHVDPETGRVLWNVTASDLESFEWLLQDEEILRGPYADFLLAEVGA